MISLYKKVILISGVAHLIIQLFVIAPAIMHNTRERDLFIYQRAATKIYHKLPLYDIKLQQNYTASSLPSRGYIYPPPLAAILTPFARLTQRAFITCWLIILLTAFWCAAAALSFMTFDKFILEGVLGWGLILGNFPGVYFGLALGQIDIILLALFTIGLSSRKEILFWATAATVKIFFVWPLIVLLFKRTKSIKQIAIGLVPILLLIIAGGWLAGWHSYVVWFKDILPTLSQGSWVKDNVSLSFGILRLFRWLGWWAYEGGKIVGIPHLWLTIASIGAPMLTYFLSYKANTHLRCALVTVAAILFAPVCWTTYTALLLPAFALGWSSWKSSAADKALTQQSQLMHS